MTSLGKLAAMARRLRSAIKRHGLARVMEMVGVTILRRGLLVTLQLGSIQRPFSHRLGEAPRAPAKRRTAAEGPASDLDGDYAMSESLWLRWDKALAGAALADDGQTPPVTFVIDNAEAAAEPLAATLAAIQAMGEAADVLAPGGTLSRPPAGSALDDRFFVFLKAGDIPSPHLPRALAQAAKGGVCQVVSFDLWRRIGDRIQPILLPGANPTLMQATDYTFSRIALRGAALPAVSAVGDPRQWVLDWLGSQAAIEARGRWRHIGRPLVRAALTDETIARQRREVLSLARRPIAQHPRESVSVILCTRDKGHLTRQIVRHLLTKGPDLVNEVVIVSNGTANPYALQTLDDLRQSPRVRVLQRDEPFNFSRLCNAGVRETRGDGHLLFLNDDIAPVSEDWLERLVARLDDPAAALVGPLLLYPDERVQHAGMYLGLKGAAGHILRGARLPQDDYLFTAVAAREVSALTGAALLARRAPFMALNGFDEQLANHLQDVDLCLRLRAIGLLNIFEPASILIHMESASIGALQDDRNFTRGRPAEQERFSERWGELLHNDPLHPRGFDVEDESLRRLRQDGRTP